MWLSRTPSSDVVAASCSALSQHLAPTMKLQQCAALCCDRRPPVCRGATRWKPRLSLRRLFVPRNTLRVCAPKPCNRFAEISPDGGGLWLLFFSPPIWRIKYVLNHSKWWFSRFSCLLLSCSGTHVYLLAVVYLFIPPPAHPTPTPSTSVFLWGLRPSFLCSTPSPRLPVSLHHWLLSWTSEGFSAISHTVTGFTAGHRRVQPGLVYSSMLRAHPFSFPDLLSAFMTVFLFQVLTHSLLRHFERTLQVCLVRARCL